VVASSESRSAKSTECGRSELDLAADFLAGPFAGDFLADFRGDFLAAFFALELPDFLDDLEFVDALAMFCYGME